MWERRVFIIYPAAPLKTIAHSHYPSIEQNFELIKIKFLIINQNLKSLHFAFAQECVQIVSD